MIIKVNSSYVSVDLAKLAAEQSREAKVAAIMLAKMHQGKLNHLKALGKNCSVDGLAFIRETAFLSKVAAKALPSGVVRELSPAEVQAYEVLALL